MSVFRLFFIFMKVSALTIGGGYAMIPVIKEYLVDKYKILSEKEFLDVIVTAQTVPGVIAINTAIILGNKLFGIKGSFFAVLGCVLPPFSIILSIAIIFESFASLKVIEGFLSGARVGVTVVLANLSFTLIKKNIKKPLFLIIIIFASAIIFLTSLSAVIVFLITALIIYFIERLEENYDNN